MAYLSQRKDQVHLVGQLRVVVLEYLEKRLPQQIVVLSQQLIAESHIHSRIRPQAVGRLHANTPQVRVLHVGLRFAFREMLGVRDCSLYWSWRQYACDKRGAQLGELRVR